MMKLISVVKTALLAASLTQAVAIQAAKCPDASRLRGGYGLNLEGSTVAGDPYVAIGVANLDRGRFTLELTRSENGKLSESSYQGEVASDHCAVTLTAIDEPGGFSLHGQIVPPGGRLLVTELRSVNRVVASGSLRRIGLSHCSLANLRGSYVYGTQGYQRDPDTHDWIAVGKTGRESFDGLGCTGYRETIKQASSIMPGVTGVLAYTVQPNCSLQLLENGLPVFQGVLVDNGRSIPYMVLQEGVTRSGEYTRSTNSPWVPGCDK